MAACTVSTWPLCTFDRVQIAVAAPRASLWHDAQIAGTFCADKRHYHVVNSHRGWAKPRMIQHKNEAKWFYRYLSIVYDHIVNPGHWTVDMRDDALEPAKLDSPDLKVSCNGGTHIPDSTPSDGIGSLQRPAAGDDSKCTPSLRLPILLCTAGGGRGRRHRLLHPGRRAARCAVQRDVDRPVAGPAEAGAQEGRPAGRHHPGGAFSTRLRRHRDQSIELKLMTQG